MSRAVWSGGAGATVAHASHDQSFQLRVKTETLAITQIFNWTLCQFGHFLPLVGEEKMWFIDSLRNSSANQKAGRDFVACTAVVTFGCAVFSSAGLAQVAGGARPDQSTPSTTSTPSKSGAPAGIKLTALELKALLAPGASFHRLPPGFTNGAEHRELFSPDGRYSGCSDRASLDGTFIVKSGQLCVDLPNEHRCRVVIRDRAGAYFQRYIDARGDLGVAIPVRISPLQPHEDCLTPEKSP